MGRILSLQQLVRRGDQFNECDRAVERASYDDMHVMNCELRPLPPRLRLTDPSPTAFLGIGLDISGRDLAMQFFFTHS